MMYSITTPPKLIPKQSETLWERMKQQTYFFGIVDLKICDFIWVWMFLWERAYV